METENKIASELASFGQAQIKAGRDAVFFGTVAASVGRIAWVKGWNGAEKGKAADYDDMVKEQIDGSRATVFRVASLIKGASAKIAKEMGNTLAAVQHETDAAQIVATVVAALRAMKVDNLQALAAWIKGDSNAPAKPSLEEQLLNIFCGTEKSDSKLDQITDAGLASLARALSIEISTRQANAAKAVKVAA